MTFFDERYIEVAESIHSARAGNLVIESILNHLFPNAAQSSVLDLGCGFGRISVPLSAHVRAVVGVDRSPALVAEAQERAAATAFAGSCEFIAGEVTQLTLDSDFDAVLLLDSVLGGDEATDQALMCAAWSALQPGGVLLCSSLNMVAVARHLDAAGRGRFVLDTRGGQVVDEVSYSLEDGSLHTVRSYEGSQEEVSVVVHLWDPSSWVRFGHHFGFDDVRITALDGTLPQMDTAELLIGMRRPA